MTFIFKNSQLFITIAFCLSMAACNKNDDYYEKQFLDNPYQEKPVTDGPIDNGDKDGTNAGVDGGTQGGVDSGVGGTNGSSTDGSTSTGGTSGGQVGSTNGGTDGSVTGGSTDGSTSGGSVDGSTVGGSSTGGTDGSVTTGGTTTGGTTTGGTTTGGTTTGGTTTGGTTTGGTTTGGTTTGGTTTGGTTTGGTVDCNQGHGNDSDAVDESNPTIALDARCKTETFHQANSQTKKLDILWIVDNSGSMADEQTSLGTNFNSFIQEFINKDVDFKMAITTTDTRSAYKGVMVTGSESKLNSAAAHRNPIQFMEDFKRMVKVGTSGSGSEKGLEASEGFMQRYTTFVRADAYLAVVILSDEEDQSSKTPVQYANYLKSFKQGAGLVKVYSIVDKNKLNSGSGITTGFERYAKASTETAGTVSDIYADFHTSLSAMGDSIINLLDSFALENTPVDGTIKVFVNRTEVTHYTFDVASRSIKFDAGHVPVVGAEIQVTYVKQ